MCLRTETECVCVCATLYHISFINNEMSNNLSNILVTAHHNIRGKLNNETFRQKYMYQLGIRIGRLILFSFTLVKLHVEIC